MFLIVYLPLAFFFVVACFFSFFGFVLFYIVCTCKTKPLLLVFGGVVFILGGMGEGRGEGLWVA